MALTAPERLGHQQTVRHHRSRFVNRNRNRDRNPGHSPSRNLVVTIVPDMEYFSMVSNETKTIVETIEKAQGFDF